MQLTFEIATFAFTLWLGLYTLRRDPAHLGLRYAGAGLVAYALSIAFLTAEGYAPAAGRWLAALLFLPAVFWFGAVAALLPEDGLLRAWLDPFLRHALPWAAGGVALLGLLVADTPGYPLLAGLVVLVLLGSVIAAAAGLRETGERETRRVRLLAVLITLFFALGAGLLLLPVGIGWLPRGWLLLGLSVDLELLGLAILWYDAYDQGESLRADMLRSFFVTAAAALVLGGQVALAGRRTGFTPSLTTLLLTVTGTAVAGAVLAPWLAGLFDRVAFSPGVRAARAELRRVESAVSRRDEALRPEALPAAKFTRLTRRALGHLPDLPRLAASPLTRLPQVDERLRDEGLADDPLGRAQALRALLIDRIARLKPDDGRAFAPTDDWRYYNALYFPYVAGLKPYSRRAWHENLDPAAREALDWFRSQVPERTLYNWQNKGAALIAADLRGEGG